MQSPSDDIASSLLLSVPQDRDMLLEGDCEKQVSARQRLHAATDLFQAVISVL
jgi:hypothetical protein